jgi:hypothetical protein
MKTLKLLLLIFLAACFLISTADAQSKKTVYEGTGTLIPYYLPCFNEMVNGTVSYSGTLVNSHWQEKMWGTLIGDDTKNVYTLMQIQNENWHPYVEGPTGVYAWTGSWKFFLDGKLVFMGHGTIHVTLTPDGEYVVQFDKEFEECK